MSGYVIVGNGVAGTSAAEEIRKQDTEGSIDFFSIEDMPFYYRIRLTEVMAGDVQEDTIVATNLKWYKDQSKKVTVVEVFPRLLPRQLDAKGASRLQAMLEDMGFRFCLGAKTTSIEVENAADKVTLDDGTSLSADLVLVSAGVRPNLELARQMNLDLDKGIKVNEFMNFIN